MGRTRSAWAFAQGYGTKAVVLADSHGRVDAASKTYTTAKGPVRALAPTSLQIARGRFMALIGPSGCDKSTLLRLIARLEQPDGGVILIRGQHPEQFRAKGEFGIAFQDPALLPWRNPGSAEARAVLAGALRQTLQVAALGLLMGLGTAYLLVVFFPAFIMLSQGFSATPRAAQDLVTAYGGSRLTRFRLVVAPFATTHLFAAAKLVAPQAILGVMVAEWLLTGVGLGNLLNASRGTMDYEMVWAGAVVSALISVAAFEAVGLLERRVART